MNKCVITCNLEHGFHKQKHSSIIDKVSEVGLASDRSTKSSSTAEAKIAKLQSQNTKLEYEKSKLQLKLSKLQLKLAQAKDETASSAALAAAAADTAANAAEKKEHNE